MKTSIVYNIQYLEALDAYLPSAFIAELKGGQLGYMQKVATPETVQSYSIHFEGTDHVKLFGIIKQLSIDGIESYFNKKKKKRFSLSKFFTDDAGKKIFRKRLDRLMDEFISIIVRNDYPICYDIQRKIFLEDIKLAVCAARKHPQIYFEKTQTGLKYALSIKENEGVWQPSNHDIHIITNEPGWIIKDYELFRLEEINGLKLKPFLNKPYIFIPERIQKDYFQKFIRDIIGKVDAEVSGFELNKIEPQPYCKLYFVEDLMSSKMQLLPKFFYKDVEFTYSDASQKRVNISFDDSIRVDVTYRNPAREQEMLGYLKSHGFGLKNGRLTDDLEDQFSIVSSVALQKEDLELKGISIVNPMIQGQRISMAKHQLSFSFTKGMDWFDLHGIVKIGDEELIFAELLNHIATGNRFFQLKNGETFILPESWMKKYGKIAAFAKSDGKNAKLSKSHFTLLDIENEVQSNQSSGVYDVEQVEEQMPIPKNLKADLRPYQLEGVQWLYNHYENGFGALLADDMGLGKTVQTITILLYAKDQIKDKNNTSDAVKQLTLFDSAYEADLNPLKALIIVPNSLIYNWESELKKFAPSLMITKYTGPNRKNIKVQHFDVILTTYHTASRDYNALSNHSYSYIILDESHYIKNRNSQLFKNIYNLDAQHKISLSGTPIENSLSDLYAQMEFINPEILGTYEFYKKHFQIPIEKYNDEEVLAELNALLDPFIMRRTRKEVLNDLPEVSEHVIYSTMSKGQKKLFEDEKSAARNFLLGIDDTQGKNKIHVFNLLLRLRKISNHPCLFDEESDIDSGKFKDVTKYLNSIVKARNKVLVFSSFLGHIELYKRYCDEQGIGHAVLTGAMSSSQRDKSVQGFKTNEDTSILFISLKAGGVGLNLTEANYVVILDPWWNPFAEKQAIARAHRMGQESKVVVTRFVSKDSIEEKILLLQKKKLSLASGIIDLGDQPIMTGDNIDFLLS